MKTKTPSPATKMPGQAVGHLTFFGRCKLAYYAFKHANTLKYKIIESFDWDYEGSGSPYEFFEAVNSRLKIFARVYAEDGSYIKLFIKPWG